MPHPGEPRDKPLRSDQDATAPSAPAAPSTEAGTPPRVEGLSPALGVVHGVILGGRYRLLRFLARGGMGEVYEALDIELGVKLALKTIRPGLDVRALDLRRFKREVLLARSVSHANVCRIYDLGVDRGEGRELLFLTMEFLAGETLGDRIKERGRMSAEEALPLVLQMTEALEAAHRAGIVHRDFKSANVMLVPGSNGERAVVTDFGLARAAADSNEEATGISSDGMVVGTPEYMAPEQVRGEPAGPRADLYALGVVLFEMMTATRPFRGDTRMATAMQRLERDPPSPRSLAPDLDPRWEDVILRCLAREPEKRFARAGDVAAALRGDGTAALPVRRDVVPAERDAFVGREAELEELESQVAHGARLVTLLGPGGTGKTRLAVRHAWSCRERFPGGVWFCDLSESRSLDGIASAVATALGVPLGKGDPVVQLGHAIAGRGQALLILDNFEQVVEHAAATLGVWLERASEARFVVTSRTRLSLPGEVAQDLGPLAEADGVQLFLSRAQAVRPGFALDTENESVVREVVRGCEGLPLALELAAARTRMMTPAQIAERMRDRFKLLAGGPGSGRHATLKAAIAGSWELLQPWERAACAQASVFEGGFTLDAAEEVLDLLAFPDAPWTVDVVQALVDKSLLRMRVPESATEPRFGMYVSLQEYASAKLGEDAEALLRAVERHGRYYARFGSDAAIEALSHHGGAAKRRALARELDNLIAGCRRALGRGEAANASATYAAAWEVLSLTGPPWLAVGLGQEVVALLTLDGSARGRAVIALGNALRFGGRMELARRSYEEALALHREVGNRRFEGIAVGNLGSLYEDQGRIDAARRHYEEALAIHREVGNRRFEGIALGSLGNFFREQGRTEEAWRHYAAAQVIYRELGDRRGESVVLGNWGNLHREQGRMDEARTNYEAALAIHRELGDRRNEGVVLANLGCLHIDQGRMDEARRHSAAALVVHRELGDRRGESVVLGNLGNLHREQGRMDEARTNYEAALAIHRELGDRRNEGVAFGNLGVLHSREGRKQEAQRSFEAALAIHRDVGNRRFEGMIDGEMGVLLTEQGRWPEARAAFDLGEVILRAVSDRMELGILLGHRGECERLAGDLDAARKALAEAESNREAVAAGPDSELGRAVTRLRQALDPVRPES